MEIWKDIPGYEGLYQASNYGRIKSIDRYKYFSNGIKGNHYRMYKGKILKQFFTTTGYYMVVLSKNGIETSQKVHQLIARTFIPNPDGYKQINHKDENPLNNHLDNLEWCDAKYNCNYGHHKENHRESLISSIGVTIDCYDLYGNLVKTYRCGVDVEKDGFNRRAVYNCCTKKARKTKNHVFRFKGDPFTLDNKRSTNRVFKFDSNGNLVHTFNSMREASRIDGFKSKLTTAKKRGEPLLFNGFRYEIEKVR